MLTFTTVLFGLALLPAAFFFGVGVYLFLAPCYGRLSGRAFVEWFQAIDPYMKARAPWVWWMQAGFTAGLLPLTSGWVFALTAGSLGFAVVQLVIALTGNLPLDRQMEHWNPDALPAGWERVRDEWLRSHARRGMASAGAFVLLLAAALVHTPPRPTEPPPAATHFEATVYLPLADNSGRSFPNEVWEQALAGLVTPFGGGTLGEPQEGCWVGADGRLVRERVRPVVISFAPARADQLRSAVRRLRQDLSQEAVYVRYGETRVELIH